MVGDDLEGVLTSQVQGGEDGQETPRCEQEEYRYRKIRRVYILNKYYRYIMDYIIIKI